MQNTMFIIFNTQFGSKV